MAEEEAGELKAVAMGELGIWSSRGAWGRGMVSELTVGDAGSVCMGLV